MLEMKNVTKTFGNFKALDDLTLTVPERAGLRPRRPQRREASPLPSGTSPASTARTAAASPWMSSRSTRILP